MGTAFELTAQNFQEVLENNPILLIDFWAEWCGPCRSFAPVFEKAATDHTDIAFAKVNVDNEQELAGAFKIQSIPTLMVFREKVLLFSQPGSLPPAALEDLISQVKNLDMEKVHAEIAAMHPEEESDEAPKLV